MKFSSYMISESVILTSVGLYPAKKNTFNTPADYKGKGLQG